MHGFFVLPFHLGRLVKSMNSFLFQSICESIADREILSDDNQDFCSCRHSKFEECSTCFAQFFGVSKKIRSFFD